MCSVLVYSPANKGAHIHKRHSSHKNLCRATNASATR